MGKKKPSLKKVIDKMADGLCLPPPLVDGPSGPLMHGGPEMFGGGPPKVACGKKDEQRMYFALADIREELDDLKRCMRALLHHHGIDYMELLKAKHCG